MKKLRIDLLSILVVALVLMASVVLWGEELGIKTPEQRSQWFFAGSGCALALAILMSFDHLRRWIDAMRVFGHRLRHRHADSAGSTQASMVATPDRPSQQGSTLEALRQELKEHEGWRLRYCKPWLLLTGDDEAIARMLPGLTERGYLVNDEVVLIWQPPGDRSQFDTAWFKQLYRLRSRRPLDGIVLAMSDAGDTLLSSRGGGIYGAHLARITRTLRWTAPVYILNVSPAVETPARRSILAVDDLGDRLIIGSEFPWNASTQQIEEALLMLRDRLARVGVQRLGIHRADLFAARLSERLDHSAAPWAAWIAGLAARRVPVLGAYFAPAPGVADTSNPGASPLWGALGRLARRDRGRPTRLNPFAVGFKMALVLIGLVTCGMLVSAFHTAHDIRDLQSIVSSLSQADDSARLRSLLALQQQISLHESRQSHRPRKLYGLGLDRNRVILDALWTRYAPASRATLVIPAQLALERTLVIPAQLALERTLASLGKAHADALQDGDAQHRGYQGLKAYLMLAEPNRADAPFLAGQIAAVWPMPRTMSIGEQKDISERLASFLSAHLRMHPEWRIKASEPLIAAARAALVNQIKLATADETVYQSIIEGARGKFADVSLPALLNGTDAQGLFATPTRVPGLYTRAAWEGVISEAIDKAAGAFSIDNDWVLATNNAAVPSPPGEKLPSGDIKRRLTERYFSEYAAAWQYMLNRLQWQPATNLNRAVDQLTRLADAQTSPLIALMKSVQYQAQAGRPRRTLGDTLVQRAQSLFEKDVPAAGPPANPLDQAFGAVLALMGNPSPAAGHDAGIAGHDAPATLNGVSLQSYLMAVTALRLKLQQISGSPDAQAMARSHAQAVFQGKLSELAQIREEAALTAASLGSAWAGFGDALFVQPLDGAWQTILQPAAASINEAWRTSVARPFNSAFEARYPFYETAADASFAELGRYVRPDSGLLMRFVTAELAGVLTQQGDRWVPNGLTPQTLTFDPEFLKALHQMSTLGAHFYISGDANCRFEIMPQPVSDVTRSELTIDTQQVVYFNQQETWTPVVWPGDGLNGHAELTWQTLDGDVREAFASTGDWAFLRLLAKAEVKQLDSARHELVWKQANAQALRYVLRTQVDAGPLALLKLRGFRLPERVFIIGKNVAAPIVSPQHREVAP